MNMVNAINDGEKYILFIGFKKLGGFDSILKAKQYASNSGLSGVFNLLGKNYRDSWYVPEEEAQRNKKK